MKMYKRVFQIICFAVILVGCNNTVKSEKVDSEKNTEVNTETETNIEVKTVQHEVSVNSTRLDEINKLIEVIDSKAATVTPREYKKPIIIGLYACSVTDFGPKKQIQCFDGGMEEREILAYYGEDKILKVAIYTAMRYNASPANLAEFDESKTSTVQYKLIFKKHNDPMYTGEIESVYNENDEKIALTEDIKTQWNSFTAAVPPY